MIWFTFVVRLDLNRSPNQVKGQNLWEYVVYRKGKDFQEAANKVAEDFDNPRIIFAAEGKISPLRGIWPNPAEFYADCGYKFEERA